MHTSTTEAIAPGTSIPSEEALSDSISRKTLRVVPTTTTTAKKQETTKRHILVVDDDRLIVAAITKGLQRAGYGTMQAASGAEALQILAEHCPDLAILDISMPEMSGFELAEHVRARTRIPLIFLSSHSEEDTFRQAAENGAIAYFVKPTNPAQIIPTIEAALANTEEIKQLRRSESLLTSALSAGREINMAIGVLMERYHLDRNRGFEILRSQARTQRRKVNNVAADLLCAEEALNLCWPQPANKSARIESPSDQAHTACRGTSHAERQGADA